MPRHRLRPPCRPSRRDGLWQSRVAPLAHAFVKETSFRNPARPPRERMARVARRIRTGLGATVRIFENRGGHRPAVSNEVVIVFGECAARIGNLCAVFAPVDALPDMASGPDRRFQGGNRTGFSFSFKKLRLNIENSIPIWRLSRPGLDPVNDRTFDRHSRVPPFHGLFALSVRARRAPETIGPNHTVELCGLKWARLPVGLPQGRPYTLPPTTVAERTQISGCLCTRADNRRVERRPISTGESLEAPRNTRDGVRPPRSPARCPARRRCTWSTAPASRRDGAVPAPRCRRFGRRTCRADGPARSPLHWD